MSSSSNSRDIKLGFGGLVATLITMGGIPIGQPHPIIYYYQTPDHFLNSTANPKIFNITLHNYGIVPASNVIISSHLDDGKFISLESIPYLSK